MNIDASLRTISPPADAGAPTRGPRPVRVDVVVPVYNEQATLAGSIRRVHAFLSDGFPFAWRIVIADNASTDRTATIALGLARELESVTVLRLDEKGRGRALRAAWTASDADVACYMDVDLSTDLRALLPLVSSLVTGHAQLAIGTRLGGRGRSPQVTRGTKREIISRAYNGVLRVALGARFSDAQCGFKAIRTDVARELLPEVLDDGWFFDTELLMAAQRRGLRIHEVAVDWIDDPDSRVDILSTALTDLRGVARLRFASTLWRFLTIGVVSTLAYAVLFLALRGPLGAVGANALALALTAAANTQANRHFAFALRGRSGLLRQHAAGGLVYLLALGLTDGALAVLHGLVSHPSRVVEVAVLIAASIVATGCRYVALRTWVFAHGGRGRARTDPLRVL